MTRSHFELTCLYVCVRARVRLEDNEQMAKVLQEEREFYWAQAQTLQESLSQLSVDKNQTEAELRVTSAAASCCFKRQKTKISDVIKDQFERQTKTC